MEDPIIMYLIIREVLLDKMSIGKTAAQVGHAVHMLLAQHYDLIMNSHMINFDESPNEQKRLEIFDLWISDKYRKVVLRADEKEWTKLKALHHVLVVDAGLTELEPNTETVIGLPPMRKSEAPKLVKRLQVVE